MDIFKDIVPSILQTKEYILSQEEEKEYNPFIVNKALSSHIDAVFYVNQMNMNPHLDKKLQYDYLFYSIKGYKRGYAKWVKYTENPDIKYIKEYFGYSSNKAKQVLSLLSPEDVKIIREKLDKGGKTPNNK
jgi:hypothetical protein